MALITAHLNAGVILGVTVYIVLGIVSLLPHLLKERCRKPVLGVWPSESHAGTLPNLMPHLCRRVSDLQNKVATQCVQLHGGWGYMLEYPIARAFLDARVQPIYGGSNEIMKELIARPIVSDK